ncbi:MAG TPA: hypothetical protein PK678_06605 [Ferruginibacter sp.]|nr:hypothetical protein [Ferruginibacter sp.]
MILVSTVLITIIIAIQLFWLQKVYRYEEKQFNINVSKSIRALYADMELVNDVKDNVQKVVENINPDLYLLKIDCDPDLNKLWINLACPPMLHQLRLLPFTQNGFTWPWWLGQDQFC